MNINTQMPNFNYVNNHRVRNNENKIAFKGINKKTGEEVIKLAENQIKAKKPNKFISRLIDFFDSQSKTLEQRVFGKKAFNERVNDHNYDVASYLNQSPKKITEMTKGASMRRLKLLDLIAQRHNAKNYKTGAENPEAAIKLFESVPYPKKGHYYLVSSYPGTTENLHRIITLAGNDTKRLDFVKKLNKEIVKASGYKTDARPELAAELLESKNINKYMDNFADYKSYLALHSKDENAVKNLDSMVEAGTFNSKKYDIKLSVKNLFESKAIEETPILNKQTIEANYSKEGIEFLDNFAKQVGTSKESLNSGNDRDILHMYKTTTKENFGIRNKILEKFEYHKFMRQNIHENDKEITEMSSLFDKIDNDKQVKKFINRVIDNDLNVSSAKEFNAIVDNVPAKKLNIFFNNAQNIIKQTSGEERIYTLKHELKNPFFKTERMMEFEQDQIEYGFKKKPSIFSKARKYLANEFNIARDKMTSDNVKPLVKNEIKEVEKVESKPVINIIEPLELPKAEEVKPVIDVDFKAVDKVKPEEIVNVIKPIELPKSNEVKPIIESESKDFIKDVKNEAINKGFVKEQVESTNNIDKSVKLAKTAPKQPNAKKLVVINDVNGVIEKKLGAKTLDEQKSDYAKKATKMRLNMLPEIFASIKETRAADRANGIKSKYSNKDALALYEKINGKNKKLVNYMLKKRNADGTRKFNIKDIITTLDDAEKQVIQNKKIAPKKYNAQSERNYYNNIFDTNVAIYGQLEKAKKQTVKQK